MSRSRLKKLLSYARPHLREVSWGIAALFAVNALGAYIPLLVRNSVDKLQEVLESATPEASLRLFLPYVFAILGLASLMWAIRVASRLLIFGAGRLVEFDLKQRIFDRLLALEPAYFANHPSGDLINRATSDVDNVRRLLGFAVLSLANTFFAYTMTLPVMLSLHLRLSLMAVAVYPAMLVVVRLVSDRLRNEQMAVQEELSNLSDLVQEDTSGIALVKIYAQEENELAAFRKHNDRLLQANINLVRTRTRLFPILSALASTSLLILLAFSAAAIVDRSLTVGGLVALIIYVERLVFPTALLGFTITTYQRGEVSVDRIEAILSVASKIRDTAASVPVARFRGHLKADGLTYIYPDTKVPALQNVSFEILPQETVAIVGPIGSGKSTLANAIPRLLDIPRNSLFLDGQDITRVCLRDLRRSIAYVPQESFLFSTSIRENIRYGSPLKSQEEIEAAAKIAQIHAEILNFPQQYETLVGERGITLSGGQRQRASLARALTIDAPVLILDDALSSVDNQTATQILENLSTGAKKRTIVFISHQLSATAIADRILVMDQGRIVQFGKHQELLASEGLYRSLWERQQLEEVLR